MKDSIKDLAVKLFDLMGVEASIEVVETGEETFEVNINTKDETGLLIGFRGENINSLQTVLGIMVKGETGKWVRLMVNVGDYRQKQEHKLEELADQAAQRAVETKEAQPIYNLTAGQRRTIHMYLSLRNDVVTESQGEGDERFLIVKAK